MKKEKPRSAKCRSIALMALALVAVFMVSCKNNEDSADSFDPGKAVVISDFTPKKGGISTRLIIYGDNFGSDPSKIKVTVGGVETKVVGTNGTSIYCIVPNKAYEGSVEVTIVGSEGETLAQVVATDKFIYEKKMLVTTLLGVTNEKGEYEIKDGPFDNCGGIAKCSWLSFDPKNPDFLYFVADGNSCRLIDLKNKYLSTIFGNGYSGLDRMRSITWTRTADTMIIATDRGGDNDQSNSTLTRVNGFTDVNVLTKSKQCNGSAIHPVNGELYFNSYAMGQVYRYDFEKKTQDYLFSIQDRDWEFNIQIHPTGDYAYIVVVNRHYILRTDYDWSRKTFTTPYIVCGEPGQRQWQDGVGKKARLSTPYQGAFVKNPAYEGKKDSYDFYFCDRDNQCIRTLSPEGKVTTFAGRGSTGVNPDAHGYIDGDLRKEARFHAPEGLVYDEINNCFYVGDNNNHRIRKIAYEE